MYRANSYVNELGIDTKVARITSNHDVYYYIPDALGSVHQLLDEKAGIVNKQVTTAWGEDIVFTQDMPDRYGFTQREHDRESGRIYSRARTLDQKLGRFMQKDPEIYEERYLLHYIYSNNNPVNFIDPLGQYAKIKEFQKLGDPILFEYGVTTRKDIEEWVKQAGEEVYNALNAYKQYDNPLIKDNLGRPTREDMKDPKKRKRFGKILKDTFLKLVKDDLMIEGDKRWRWAERRGLYAYIPEPRSWHDLVITRWAYGNPEMPRNTQKRKILHELTHYGGSIHAEGHRLEDATELESIIPDFSEVFLKSKLPPHEKYEKYKK